MSKIEWTDRTWNPVTGCTPVSPACQNCYARRMARRLAGRFGYPEAPHHFDVTLHPKRWDEPLKRKKPTMYFVTSMGDLFHEDVPSFFIADTWEVMRLAKHHTFQILTKRPQRLLDEFWIFTKGVTLPNVWIGVTTENQTYLDERWDIVRELVSIVPVLFFSFEPLLGPIKFSEHFRHAAKVSSTKFWVIVGGESGPGARPMEVTWARSLRDQCLEVGVPFFFKQYGGVRRGPGYDLLDGKEWKQFPEVQR